MRSETTENSIKYYSEVYRYRFLRRSNMIYLILLLLLLCLAVSLPIIRVDIYKSAPGIIKSTKSKILLKKTRDVIPQEFKNLDIHNSLYSGSSIAEMSPQIDLFVECYIPPQEIGSLKKNQSVQFQIDVFDHRKWGLASGLIRYIPNEITLEKERAVFKVICSLNESDLLLNEHIKGKLINGMTVKALFFDRNGSLFTFLFNQTDNWDYTTRG